MASSDDELRAAARKLLEKRAPIPVEEEPPESLPPGAAHKKKRTAAELAQAAAAPGAGLIGIIALVSQLLQARISPEQVKAMQDRIDALERERSERRVFEFSRDKVINCRIEQGDGYLQSILPRRDQQVAPPPRAWFDKCPDLLEPTTGSKAAAK